MKYLVVVIIGMSSMLWFSGCYTQFATVEKTFTEQPSIEKVIVDSLTGDTTKIITQNDTIYIKDRELCYWERNFFGEWELRCYKSYYPDQWYMRYHRPWWFNHYPWSDPFKKDIHIHIHKDTIVSHNDTVNSVSPKKVKEAKGSEVINPGNKEKIIVGPKPTTPHSFIITHPDQLNKTTQTDTTQQAEKNSGTAKENTLQDKTADQPDSTAQPLIIDPKKRIGRKRL